ncbi:TonB-dependent receptor family protein [Parasphingorhabdus sp.]|uniref:TonB-dependent receptor family protein n=1 Tax=Parasphingorhabdus sp. TaxID=2709688 RepID=UPI0035933C44
MIRRKAGSSCLALAVAGLWCAPLFAETAEAADAAEAAEAGNGRVIDAIVVTANKADTLDVGGSVQRLDSEDLDLFSYNDVNRVLRQVPGVYLQEEDGFGLRPNIGIRGSGTDRSARIALMEDGVLIAPAPYSAPAAYYFPRMARIAGVEVAKGPAAIKYGPMTVGGALNLFSTPIPDVDAGTLSGKAELLAGNYDGRRAHGWAGGWAPLGGGLEIGALAEGLYEHSDGFKQLDIGGNTGFEITDWTVKLGLRSTDGRHALEFKYQNYDETSNETYLGLTLADFAATPYRRYNGSQVDQMNAKHKTYQLSHRFDISPDVNLTTIAYRTDTARAWYKLNDVRNTTNTGWVSISSILENPDANPVQMADLIGADGFTGRPGALRVRNNNRIYQATGVQSVLSANFSTGGVSHALELSARYHEDEEDRFQQDDRYQMVDGRMILTSAGAPGSQDNRLGDAKAWAFFIRDTIEAGPLTLVPGLRYETIDLRQTRWATSDPDRVTVTSVDESTVDVFIPGISATWRVADEVRLIAGAHRGFSSPGPGSTVDSETSWNYEAGLKLGSNGWRAEIIGFFNDYGNLIGICTASTGGDCNIGDQFAGGKVDVKGVEISASRTLGSIAADGFELPVSLAYTFTDAEFKTSFASDYGPWGTVTAGDQLPYIPRHQMTVNAGLVVEGARLNATLGWVGKARATAGSGPIALSDRIDDRVLVDLSAEVDLLPNLSLFGSVQNLFDVTYNAGFSPAGARPGAPRLALGGIRARF